MWCSFFKNKTRYSEMLKLPRKQANNTLIQSLAQLVEHIAKSTEPFTKQFIQQEIKLHVRLNPVSLESSSATGIVSAELTANTSTELTANTATEPTSNTSKALTANTATEPISNTSKALTANTATEPTSNTSKAVTANTATEPISNTSKALTANTSISAFGSKFGEQARKTLDFLTKKLPEWHCKPLDFWGPELHSLSHLSSSTAVCHLYNVIDRFEDEKLITPMRRRISLVRLDQFRRTIEDRVQSLAQRSQIKISRSTTHKSISINVLCSLLYESDNLSDSDSMKKKIMSRLRAGERCSQLRPGMLLALGDALSDQM